LKHAIALRDGNFGEDLSARRSKPAGGERMAVSDPIHRTIVRDSECLPTCAARTEGMEEAQLLQIQEGDSGNVIDRVQLWGHERRQKAPLTLAYIVVTERPSPNICDRHTGQA